MTAVFDNLIIGSGIVAYDETKILGLKIFLAPIEDFAYTLAAVLMIPAIWNSLRSRM
jgi:lycopene cyclase domain-containing protein